MSTKRPKPELSAHFIRDKRLLKAADTAKYNARLKEIDLPDDYAIYGYEPSSGRKPAAYWVCKQSVGECPECGTPYLEDAIASVSESKLTHYCRVAVPHEGEKPTYDIHPATLYLRRIRWMCYNCYSKLKTYNAKMQDDSQLVDEKDKKLTLQLKKYLGQQAMHMEINTLAEIFDISPHTVKNCFDKALAEYEKRRNWDDISTLGLYTVTLNVQGQQTNFCLCADVDTESLIELFAYEDKEAAANFLSKLKNKQNIQRVFISIDSAAFNFAKTNFPIKTIMVDRLDVRKRLLNGLETVKKGNDDSQDFPILRRHWKLLKNVEEAIPANSKDYVFLKEVLNAFPHVGDAYWLKEAGMDIYRKTTGQCKLVNDWISSDKYNILPYEQLEQYMIQAQEPVVRFAVQYNGVDRSRYEKAILEAESPLINYVGLTSASKSALWSRAASFKMIRARVLYGAAMMANYFAAQEPNEKSHEEYAIHVLKNQFNEDHQRAFTKNCRGFVRLYEFLSMASSFGDPELHKKYVFVNLLLTYLVVGNSGGISLKDKIQATNFWQESQGDKGNKQRHASAPNVKLSGADVGLTVDEVKHLSEIIDEVNSRAGKGYDNSAMTKVMLQIKDLLLHSDKLKTSAKNNTEQDFEFSFYDNTDDALIEGLSQNQDFFSLLLSNDDIKHRVLGVFLHEVYKELREQP